MIIVVGMGRSGTSMTCGVLAACGADFGKTIGPHPENPRGFFEHRGVRDNVIKPILRRAGADPLGQTHLPAPEDMPHEPRFRDQIEQALNGANAMKCAKAMLLWPLFVEHFPDARYVIVRRSREQVIASCERTSFMRHRGDWGAWYDGNVERLEEIKARLPSVEVWPDPNDPDVFMEAVDHCGLEFDRDAVDDALMPEAWHG